MKKYNPLPKKNERTVSYSSPRNSRRGCLCRNRNEYSVRCCDGLLIEQGIGVINANPPCIPISPNYFVWEITSSAAPGPNFAIVTYVDINNVSQSIQYWVQPATVQPSMNYVVSKEKPIATQMGQTIFIGNEPLAPYGTCFEVDVTLVSSKDTMGGFSIQPRTQGNQPFQLPISMSYFDCCGLPETLVFNTAPSTKRICVTEISEQLTLEYQPAGISPPLDVYWSPFRLNVVTSSISPSYIVCKS